MKLNMGAADRAIRIVVAIAIAVLYFTHLISGTLAIVLGIIAIAFVLTSFTGWCPLYLPLRVSTRRQPPAPPA